MAAIVSCDRASFHVWWSVMMRPMPSAVCHSCRRGMDCVKLLYVPFAVLIPNQHAIFNLRQWLRSIGNNAYIIDSLDPSMLYMRGCQLPLVRFCSIKQQQLYTHRCSKIVAEHSTRSMEARRSHPIRSIGTSKCTVLDWTVEAPAAIVMSYGDIKMSDLIDCVHMVAGLRGNWLPSQKYTLHIRYFRDGCLSNCCSSNIRTCA